VNVATLSGDSASTPPSSSSGSQSSGIATVATGLSAGILIVPAGASEVNKVRTRVATASVFFMVVFDVPKAQSLSSAVCTLLQGQS
jgi:hypothetical protein